MISNLQSVHAGLANALTDVGPNDLDALIERVQDLGYSGDLGEGHAGQRSERQDPGENHPLQKHLTPFLAPFISLQYPFCRSVADV
jgi:hypothetical protein